MQLGIDHIGGDEDIEMMTMMVMMMMIELDGFTNNMLVGDQRGGGNDVEEIGFGTGRPSHDLDGNFSKQT